jgi:hypothetical protein
VQNGYGVGRGVRGLAEDGGSVRARQAATSLSVSLMVAEILMRNGHGMTWATSVGLPARESLSSRPEVPSRTRSES